MVHHCTKDSRLSSGCKTHPQIHSSPTQNDNKDQSMVRQCKTQSLPGAAKEKEVVLVEELEMAQDSEQALEMV